MKCSATLRRFPLLGICALALFSLPTLNAEPPLTGPHTEARFPPLNVPAGFKATLFACDPLIEYPSAIAVGPRTGAIFVAVDYMTGLGTEIVRRSEVRLVEDTNGDGYADHAPVFAAGFNSIQGLAWREGTLYVMHAPFLTALRDSQPAGTTLERKDFLTGLGLTPEENPVRLHCANGVTVGHDGWLYLALGDHGCDVPRPEGDRLVLQGGGILRCRPDGRDLHIFSTGLRNIYDVALDHELNVFVRDNENDGGTYKNRLYHSFHGADHGYPYLYEERPDEALPPLADRGLGSSAGGVCYLERQFPAGYRGNLLFCQWGKAVVRSEPRRQGSSFAPLTESEFATGAAGDTYGFKPTDAVVERDGTLVVADYADGQRPKRGRGRIYRITYPGDGTKAAAEPERAAPGTDSDKLLVQLDSESYAERCDAQAALERLGGGGVTAVDEALRGNRLGILGRLHAVWILASAGGQQRIDQLFALAKSDSESSVRAQAIRAIADLSDPVLALHRLDAGRGDAVVAARLAALGKGHDPRVTLEIIVALGRLHWVDTADWLRENLNQPDSALAHGATQALRRCDNWPAILKLLDAPSNDTLRPIALRALAERYEPSVVDGLIQRLSQDGDASRRREYADLLTRVWQKPGPWVYWGYRPPPRPANAVAWERTAEIALALERVLADPDRAVRLDVLRRIQRERIPASVPALGEWLRVEREPERVAAILAALSEQPGTDARPHCEAVARDPDHNSANRLTALSLFAKSTEDANAQELLALAQSLEDGPVLAAALRSVAKYPPLAATSFVAHKLSSLQPEVRAAATEVLTHLRPEELRRPLVNLLADNDARVRSAAAVAAGTLAAKEAIEPLLKLATESDASVRRASLAALTLLEEERAVPLAVAALGDRNVATAALECLRELGGVAQAGAVADLAQRDPTAEALVAAVRVLTYWRDLEGANATSRQDLDRAVAEIHGASGVLVRWEAEGPPSDSTAARTIFASGAEARVLLPPPDAAQTGPSFVQAEVRVPESTDVEFLVASSGSLEVWLNDKSLHRREGARPLRPDFDHFAATLHAGTNRLRVAVAPSAAPAEFHLRFRRKSASAEHERLTQAALARAGNAERGRLVFQNTEKTLCLKCHRVGDQGERAGPELTGVGARFARIYIVESILEPSRTIAPSFAGLSVRLSDGQALAGIKVAETETTITLADNQGQKHVLPIIDIDEQKPAAQSIMPDGLERRLTPDEFVDLIAFLMSLKETREP